METNLRYAGSFFALLVLVFGLQANSFGQYYGQVVIAETFNQNPIIHSAPFGNFNAIPSTTPSFNEFAHNNVMYAGYAETYPVMVAPPEPYPVMAASPTVANQFMGQPVPIGHEIPVVSAEPVMPQLSDAGAVQYINGVPTLFSSDVGYAGPGDMRTHLWNDHKQDMKAHGFTRAQVKSMSLQTAQKWHNFFHGSEGLPSETR